MTAARICPQCGRESEADVRFCPYDGATLRATAATGDLVGQVIADRYHVLRKLGEGGMGQVYLAEHVRMGRKSAVKVMHPGMAHDPDAVGRFNREASNAARINHAHVAAIYDFGETTDGLIYLAMEFVEGEPLTALLERQGALPPARAADLARQTAEALVAAHEMQIVHRDLKPDNIMIARQRDGSDCVKVVDFGIAKAMQGDGQNVTRTGLVVGTPEYMSPEQLAGDTLDGRSDLYSLALVTFTMLTGRLPFPSESSQESMIMRLTDRPRTLAQMKGDVAWPDELQRVMDRALARDAADRYARATDFTRELARAVQRMPGTEAATAGTLVMDARDAVPATRVSRTPTRTPAAESPPARRPRTRVALVGGGTIVAALAIGGWYLLSAPARAESAARDSGLASPSGADTPVATVASSNADSSLGGATPASEHARQPPVTPRPPASAAPRTDESPSTGAPAPRDARAELAALRATMQRNERTQNAAELGRLIEDVGMLLPLLQDRDDIVEARFLRAQARGFLSDEGDEGLRRRACEELAELRQTGAQTRFIADIRNLYDLVQCP